MEVLKRVGNVTLNKGYGAANGLFNLSNIETNEVSFWFDDSEADDLLSMSDDNFLAEARVKFEYAQLS